MLPPHSGAEGAPRERKEIPMSQRRQKAHRQARPRREGRDRAGAGQEPAGPRDGARPGTAQSSVADEVRRNRTVTRGPGKGSRVESVPEGACARLRGWPHVCNGCNKRRYHCSMLFRCEYSAARAQLLADGELSAARRGVNRTEEEFVDRRQDQGRPGPRPVAGADIPRPLVRVAGPPPPPSTAG